MTDQMSQASRDLEEIREGLKQHRINKQVNNFLSLVFDSIPLAGLLMDTNGKIIRVNEVWSEIMKTPSSYFQGKLLAVFLHPMDRERTMEAMISFNVDGNEMESDFYNRYLVEGGDAVWLKWFRQKNGYKMEGFALGFAEVVNDLSKIKELENLYGKS